MSLFRCSHLLNRVNVCALPLKQHSFVYFSDDAKSSKGNESAENRIKHKNDDGKTGKSPESSVAAQQERLRNLLSKLSGSSTLKIVKDVQTTKPLGYKKLKKIKMREETPKKSKKAADATKAVATEMGDDGIEKDLLDSLETPATGSKSKDLDDIIAAMKMPKTSAKKTFTSSSSSTKKNLVGSFKANSEGQESEYRSKRRTPLRKPAEIKSTEEAAQYQAGRNNLFDGQPMGIFEPEKLVEQEDQLTTWQKLEKHELRLHLTYAPRNYFEKMAYWTEEGKIWRFPIDNEQGLDDEHRTSFTEHVFLEERLEPWCPRKGSIRNFMELICIGLSKNPYLTVQQKHEHIDWYRDYFEEKRDILQRVIEQSNLEKQQIGEGKKE